MCFQSGNSVFRRLLFCHHCLSLDAQVAALGVGIAAFALAVGLQLQLCSDSLRKGIVVREAVRIALIQGIFLVVGVHIFGENVVIVVLGAYIAGRKEEVQRLAGAAADCRGRYVAVIAFALFGVAEFVVVVLEILVRQNQPFSPLNSAESISAPEMPLRKAVALVFSGAESMSMQQQRDFP